ncbi:hypothetical protein AMATHDRAFT_49179 [Amanita thiersii Skay4041]|uniref:Uncharacterized protein n=1 Tax=Amanita thiersii Skay4041 TaxID=703135 RepID=A0A2A9NHN2_9AGAR|nr:hypothetical protein AMATHDRAFT_49179 [Amanita thiersii Skay4041]
MTQGRLSAWRFSQNGLEYQVLRYARTSSPIDGNDRPDKSVHCSKGTGAVTMLLVLSLRGLIRQDEVSGNVSGFVRSYEMHIFLEKATLLVSGPGVPRRVRIWDTDEISRSNNTK